MKRDQLDLLLKSAIMPATYEAMRATDRAKYVLPELRAQAYEDRPLSIGYDVTISQPSLVGKMIDYLQVEPISNILELGTGSAYNAAVLSKLISNYGSLTTVERVKPLAARARKLLTGAPNTTVIASDALAVKYAHPFDRIIVTAEFLDESTMKRFLKANAAHFCIAVYPMGGKLWRMVKCGDQIKTESLMGVRFVPVLGGER